MTWKAIVRKFVAEKWKKIPKKAAQYIVTTNSDLVKDHKKATSWNDPNSNTNNTKPQKNSYMPRADTTFDKNLSQLIDMGFSIEVCLIQITSDDIDGF